MHENSQRSKEAVILTVNQATTQLVEVQAAAAAHRLYISTQEYFSDT